MQTQPEFGLKELLTHVVGGITTALGDRAGESQQQRFIRTQAAAHAVVTFRPLDAIEAMIAGHCLMFHEMIVDSVRYTLGRELEGTRRTTRANIIALDKAFGNNLNRLARYRAGLTDGKKPAQPVDTIAETEIADRARRHRPEPNRPEPNRPDPTPLAAASQKPVQPASGPSPEAIAACEANPEAMAALNAGDPARFARAMGVEPSEGYLAAASVQMAAFNRQPAAVRPPTFRAPTGQTPGPTQRQANP